VFRQGTRSRAFVWSLDKGAHIVFSGHANGNAWTLESRRRRIYPVQTRPRILLIDRYRSSFDSLRELLTSFLTRSSKFFFVGASVRARRSTSGHSSSCRRRPRVQIARAGECLPADSRSHELSISLDDCRSRGSWKTTVPVRDSDRGG